MKIVTCRVYGGLGNQLFCYAAARALSVRNGAKLKIDNISGFINDVEYKRTYRLDNFNIPCEKTNTPYSRYKLKILKLLSRYFKIGKNRYIQQVNIDYDPNIIQLKVNNDLYIEGYWQSERYFQAFQDLIREDFSFRTPMSPQNQKTYDKISSCEAISLHIRRGDYISDQNTFNTHGVCSMDYYEKALEFIYRQCNNPVLFVFSDDMAWVKENFNFDKQSYFIENNCGDDSYNDMRLMSSCKHHILANSSFSWWGAWLNSSAEKVVVTPRCWFASDRFDTRDLIPAEWIKL